MKGYDSNNGKGGGEEKADTQGWLTTFSDLMMLLLTFFVLLFSLGSMDDRQLKIAFQNFEGSSGFLFFKEYSSISRPKDAFISSITALLGDKVVTGRDSENLNKNTETGEIDTREFEGVGGLLIIDELDDGLNLTFGEKLLFAPGSAEIHESIRAVLDRIARFISLAGYQAYVDGHTDNAVIAAKEFPSNEELSIARAFSVWSYLVQEKLVDPDSVALTGYGALKPVGSNDSPKGRQMNRRVEIILKYKTYF